MDAGVTRSWESLFMQVAENAVRAAMVTLVLTGQMLPAGAVSAQDAPVLQTPTDADRPIEPPLAESLPEDTRGEATEAVPAPTKNNPAEAAGEAGKAAEAAAQAVKEAVDAVAQEATAPAQESVPMVVANELEPTVKTDEHSHTLGDWTMIIRPGSVPPKPAPFIQVPLDAAGPCQSPSQVNNVSVPVNVHVNNNASPYWGGWGTPYPVPATYPSWWTSPTSAYLFQRPLPYWSMRGDFHLLAPYIPGLWY